MPSPNIIVFFTDQQRWDCSGLHGNPLDLMPNFDRIARLGTHVANSFTSQPVCGPARSIFQTGLYPTTSGCYRNAIGLPTNMKTLAHHFNAAGFQTAYIGKWHLAHEPAIGPCPPDQRGGYQTWLASNLLEFTSDAYDTRVYDNDNKEVILPGYRVDALTDAAIRYIDTAAKKQNPFYLFLSFLEPHHQNHRDDYPAPEGYTERYTGRWMPPDLTADGTAAHHLGGYYGMVKRLDEAFGRLLETLTSLHLRDNTVVLFTSDHGCHFKTRNAEYKRSGHESSIRIPTAFTGGPFSHGGALPQLVSLIDLSPTLLDAAGIPIPQEMQGHSILPLLKDKTAPFPQDVFIQISESEVGRALRTHRWKYLVTAPDRNGWNDSNSPTYQEVALYDLLADPYENENLIGFQSHKKLTEHLRIRLISRMQQAGETPPQILPAPEKKSGARRVDDQEITQ